MQPTDEVTEGGHSRQQELECWFQSTLGRSLLASQRQIIANIIPNFFGFMQIELGVSHRVPMGNSSNIGNKYLVIPEWVGDLPTNVLVSETDELSLDTDSVDLLILHHTLDYATDPHQTLREAARVLKSTGHLVLIGFNPTSVWGFRRLFNRAKKAPWNNRFISGKRVEDWLNLLHFEVGELAYHYYGLPFNNGAYKQFMWLNNIINTQVPLGAYYILSAQKQTFSRIQQKQHWLRSTPAVGLRLSGTSNVKNFKSGADLKRIK